MSSYKLVTETTFRSDADKCPICGKTPISHEGGFRSPVDLYVCDGEHAYYYLQTVTGPTTGAGEIGYWVQR